MPPWVTRREDLSCRSFTATLKFYADRCIKLIESAFLGGVGTGFFPITRVEMHNGSTLRYRQRLWRFMWMRMSARRSSLSLHQYSIILAGWNSIVSINRGWTCPCHEPGQTAPCDDKVVVCRLAFQKASSESDLYNSLEHDQNLIPHASRSDMAGC